MRTMLLTAVLCATGCVAPTAQVSHAASPKGAGEQPRFQLIEMEYPFQYLIDPYTESCFLRHLRVDSLALVPVSCAKLKKNVPEAAAFITWEPDTAPATPSTGTPPAR